MACFQHSFSEGSAPRIYSRSGNDHDYTVLQTSYLEPVATLTTAENKRNPKVMYELFTAPAQYVFTFYWPELVSQLHQTPQKVHKPKKRGKQHGWNQEYWCDHTELLALDSLGLNP